MTPPPWGERNHHGSDIIFSHLLKNPRFFIIFFPVVPVSQVIKWPIRCLNTSTTSNVHVWQTSCCLLLSGRGVAYLLSSSARTPGSSSNVLFIKANMGVSLWHKHFCQSRMLVIFSIGRFWNCSAKLTSECFVFGVRLWRCCFPNIALIDLMALKWSGPLSDLLSGPQP